MTEKNKPGISILGRIKKNPRLIVLAIYWISAVAAFFICPDGIAISVGDSDSIPTVLYVIVAGILITVFSLAKRAYFGSDDEEIDRLNRRTRASLGKAWIGLIILMLLHFFVLSISMQ